MVRACRRIAVQLVLSMKSHKVLIATHETLIPPESVAGLSMQEVDTFRVEYDVREALRRLGHQVEFVGMGDSVGRLREAVQAMAPDIVFNLLEEFGGIVTYDHHMVGVFSGFRHQRDMTVVQGAHGGHHADAARP
jgi:hypothetical protein